MQKDASVSCENCPNIDLVVCAQNGASYVQVKSSENPAGADSVIIDGFPWTEAQLHYLDHPGRPTCSVNRH